MYVKVHVTHKIILVRFINSKMLKNYYWPHPRLVGADPAFGKVQFYDLIKLALVEYENEVGGGEEFEMRRDSPNWRSDFNFLPQTSLHNRSICPTPRVRLGNTEIYILSLGNMSLMRAVCFANS